MTTDYDDGESGLLEDFENEIRKEESSRKKNKILILIGLIAGVVIAAWLAGWFGGDGAKQSVAQKAIEEIEKSEQPVDSELESKPAQADDIESKLADLSKQNQIEDDISQSGDETAVTGENDSAEPARPEFVESVPDNPVGEPERQNSVAPDEPAITSETVNSVVETSTEIIVPELEKAKEEKTVQKTEVTKIQPTPPAHLGSYAVSLLATTDAARALDLRDRLSAKKISAWISVGKVKKSLYRVESRVYKSISKSAGESRSMSSAGYTNKVVYLPGADKNVVLDLGGFNSRKAAMSLAERAKRSGFSVYVKERNKPLSLYMVMAGRYKRLETAKAAQRQIRDKGYKTLGIKNVK